MFTHLPNEGLDATGTTVGLVESDLTNDRGTVLPIIQNQLLFSYRPQPGM